MNDRPWIGGTRISKAMVHAGWLLDGTGDRVRSNVFLEIEGGKLAGIRRSGEGARIDDTVPFLDFSGCTLIPPLIDVHVHLFMSAAPDPVIRQRQLNEGFDELLPVMSRHMSDLKTYGVISVRDGGDYGGHALRLRNELKPGFPVRLRAAGKAWRRKGRYGRLIGRPVPAGTSLEASIRFDTDRADHVKLVNSGINSLTTFGRLTQPQFSFDELKAGVRAAHDLGLPVMVHCNGDRPVLEAVKAGCDSVEHGFFMNEETLSRIADSETVWVPTACTMKAYAGNLPSGSAEADVALRTFEHQLKLIEMGRRLGVTIAVGTDAGSLGVYHGPSVAMEMAILAEAGFPIPEVVRCATVNGASLLGHSDLGPIRPGATIRFLAVEGDPDCLLKNLALRRFSVPGEKTVIDSLESRNLHL